jgi:hypothetical protein
VNFIKKHYEKILLAAVLLILVAAVFLILFKISSEQVALERKRSEILHLPVRPLAALNLSGPYAAVERAKLPVNPDFSGKNNLFNPVPWAKAPDGRLIKIVKVAEGPSVVEVTKVSPLYLSITLDSVGASGSNYLITVVKEAEAFPSKRRTSRYVTVGGKTDFFTLREVKGPPDKPTALVLELNDTGERITITPEQGYKKVDGYTVDLRYEPEKRSWTNRRLTNTLTVGGDEYTISQINLVATNHFEVVLSAKASGKKTTLKYNAAP